MSYKLIILVEDDPNLRQSIALILQRAGYIVSATDCAYQALDLLRSRKYHLVITDNNIPETRDVLLPKVLDIFPYLPIVVLTDKLSLESEGQRRLLSAHYLVKPIAPELLLDQIRMIMGEPNNSLQNKNISARTGRNQEIH